MNNYILGSGDDEFERLQAQSKSLFDERLIPLVKKSNRILEVGCGVGSNWGMLRSYNDQCEYVGVDIDAKAVSSASISYEGDARCQFIEMTGDALVFQEGSFDLVIIRLVLWAAGSQWNSIIHEAYRVLSDDGVLYSFEPEDRLLIILPEHHQRDSFIKKWQEAAREKGDNPFIGSLVHSGMHLAGFRRISTVIDSRAVTGLDLNAISEKARNLERIFLNDSTESVKKLRPEQLHDLRCSFRIFSDDSFIADSYVTNIGVK